MKRRNLYLGVLVLGVLALSFLPMAMLAGTSDAQSIGWYIVPYVRDYSIGSPQPARHCELCLYNKQIWDAGGKWTCVEVLGNRAIVKIKAPAAILNMIDSKYKRLPKDRLGDSLSDLPNNIKIALKNEILDMGYTIAEVKAKFGSDLGQFTLRDVLKFMAKRRLKPRYIPETDTIVCDGIEQRCRNIEYVNSKVQ